MSDQVLSQWWKRVSSISSQDTSSTDMVLVSDDGERVVCHQLVLALASPILNSLLQEHKSEEVVINLPEVEGRTVRSLLGVVYNRYLPSSLEDQQDIDKLAQMLGFRVRHSKSNIVFKCDNGEIEELNYYEPYLEEQTTFLYVDEVKPEDMLTLNESETYEVNVSEENELEVRDIQCVQTIDSSENQIELETQHDDEINEACASLSVPDLVNESKLIIEDRTVDDKIFIVPIDSHEEIIHETIEIENTVEKKQKHSNARKLQIRQLQSQPCFSCNKPTINHKFQDLVSLNWSYHCCFCTKTNMKSAAAFVRHIATHVPSKCQLCQKSKLDHKENKHFFCCRCKKKVLGSKLSFHVQKHMDQDQDGRRNCQEENVKTNGPVNLEHGNPTNGAISAAINEANPLTPTVSGTPRLNCPSCSKSMTRRHYTKHHKASCSKERVLKCDICGREGFCNSSTLQDHIRAKHTLERPFKCDYCNKAFPAASHLAHHRMKKHRVNSKGELQQKVVFPCNFCGKTLTTKPKLLAHVKVIHQGIKDFTCKSCKKSFSSKSNLDIHIGSVHTGNLPYKCEFCSKSFARKNLLSAHRQTAHQFIEAQSVHSQGAL